jgi:hypothetical protein
MALIADGMALARSPVQLAFHSLSWKANILSSRTGPLLFGLLRLELSSLSLAFVAVLWQILELKFTYFESK